MGDIDKEKVSQTISCTRICGYKKFWDFGMTFKSNLCLRLKKKEHVFWDGKRFYEWEKDGFDFISRKDFI